MGSDDSVVGLFEGSASTCRFDDGTEVAARELVDDGRRLAGRLAADGWTTGDRLAIHLPNGPDYVRLLLACAVGGFVAISVNTRYAADEVADLVARSGARPPSPPPPWRDAAPMRGDAGADAPFVVFTTSGTTSRPKMVLHHQRSIARHAHDAAHGFGYGPDDRVLVAMPLCGTFGLTSLTAAVAGGGIVVVTEFELDHTAHLIEHQRITAVNGSDDMFHRLLTHGADLSSIRLGGYARFNTSLDRVVTDAALAGATLTGLYGMSEVQALYSVRDPSLDAGLTQPGRRHPRLTGRCVPGGRRRAPAPWSEPDGWVPG